MLLKKLGWWDELTEAEKKAAEGKNWKTDLSGGIQRVVMKNHGCHPFGNAKARAVVWNFPDPIPQHREPLYINRARPGRQVPDARRQEGVLAPADAVQDACRRRTRTSARQFPLIMTSGRLVEYEGGGEETRSNPWLAELQQEMFVEINPAAANDRGIRNGDYGLGQAAEPARSINASRRWSPSASAATRCSCRSTSRAAGRASTCCRTTRTARTPVVRGEAVNTATTYGYDSVTMMQETKTTLCQIERA